MEIDNNILIICWLIFGFYLLLQICLNFKRVRFKRWLIFGCYLLFQTCLNFERVRVNLKRARFDFLKSFFNFLKSLVNKLEEEVNKLEEDWLIDFCSGGVQKIEKVANCKLRFVLFKYRSLNLYYDSIEERDYYYEKYTEYLNKVANCELRFVFLKND